VLHLLAQLLDLLRQPFGLGLDLRRLRAVGRLQGVEVALDALLDLTLASIDLAGREVAVAAVDRLELAAVDSSDGVRLLPVQGDRVEGLLRTAVSEQATTCKF
jgi:hypothetical protein